jgi:uncharacterized protein with von Willebrand factor type A (vWA) domain
MMPDLPESGIGLKVWPTAPWYPVETKDLGHFNQADVQVASLALKKMMAPFQVEKTRRLKAIPQDRRNGLSAQHSKKSENRRNSL